MFFFVAFLICTATALFIGAPLFQRGGREMEAGTPGFRPDGGSPSGTPTSSALEERRDTLLLALKELEFDRSMGKIEESDYDRLRGATAAEAAAVLSQLEDAGAPLTLPVGTGSTSPRRPVAESALRDAEIEAEVLVARARRRTREKSAKRTEAEGWLCAQCGRDMGQNDRFCATCGAARTSQPVA
jgi:hypothetical protein